jgi:hypothetical protein
MIKGVYAIATVLLLMGSVVRAEDTPPREGSKVEVETTYLFGFTQGGDTPEKGKIEAESQTTGRFGKDTGTYTALLQEFSAKFAPFENLSIAPGIGFYSYSISGVTGLTDTQQGTFDSVFLEMRYRILDRKTAPFGLTVGADPYYSRVDEIAATLVNRWGADFWLIADKELLENKLFGALNLGYTPQTVGARDTGLSTNFSRLTSSAAFSYQFAERVFAGVEARYLRAYDQGLGLNRLAGQAFYVGPTFFANLGERAWVSMAWGIQVAGYATDAGAGTLDLTNFERQQARLHFGYTF